MQQLDALLLLNSALTKTPAKELSKDKAEAFKAQVEGASRFASQLSQLTAGGKAADAEETAAEGNIEVLRSLAESLLKSADDDALSETDHDAWLSMVEEFRAVVADADSEGLLQNEAGKPDSDIRVLLENILNAVSDGKELPHTVDALVSYSEASDAQKSALEDVLDEFAAILKQIRSGGDSTDNLTVSAEQLKEQLAQVSEDLQAQLRKVFSDDELAGSIAQLTEYLLAEGSEHTWNNMLDSEDLIAGLEAFINDLQAIETPANYAGLITALENRIAALEADDELNDSANSKAGYATEEEIEELSQLLALLQQGFATLQSDKGEPHIAMRVSALTPVGEALNRLTQQFRAQVEALQNAQGDSADTDAVQAAVEQGRRLMPEQAQMLTNNESRLTNMAASQTQQLSSQNFAQARDAATSRMAETPVQTPFEAARQAQQIVDILGPGAAERLRERVSVMFNARTQAAEMRLDPPDLGRLTIRLNMNQEQASVNFQVTTPQAREALEQSLPRLRELLQEQGIALADANVSEQQQGNDQAGGSLAGEAGEVQGSEDEFAEVDQLATVESPVVDADGRVDYYA